MVYKSRTVYYVLAKSYAQHSPVNRVEWEWIHEEQWSHWRSESQRLSVTLARSMSLRAIECCDEFLPTMTWSAMLRLTYPRVLIVRAFVRLATERPPIINCPNTKLQVILLHIPPERTPTASDFVLSFSCRSNPRTTSAPAKNGADPMTNA